MNFNQTLSSLRHYKKLLRRELVLLWKSPREYIYSYTYSPSKKIRIEKYDPNVTKLGEDIIKKIRKKHPSLKVHFLGSAALKIAGQKDIDLLAESSPEKFDEYVPTLVSLLGEPVKKRQKFVEWHTEQNGCSIEIILIDPISYIFQGPIKTFTILKNNKRLLREYEKLKIASNGVSVREYKKRRLEFFNKIMAQKFS